MKSRSNFGKLRPNPGPTYADSGPIPVQRWQTLAQSGPMSTNSGLTLANNGSIPVQRWQTLAQFRSYAGKIWSNIGPIQSNVGKLWPSPILCQQTLAQRLQTLPQCRSNIGKPWPNSGPRSSLNPGKRYPDLHSLQYFESISAFPNATILPDPTAMHTVKKQTPWFYCCSRLERMTSLVPSTP